MGFLDFMKNLGGGILSGIGKAANFVSKYASPILSMIPSPLTQGIAQAANLISGATQGAQPAAQQPAEGGGTQPAAAPAGGQPVGGGGAGQPPPVM
jgi:hypothetical protein